MQVGDSAPSVFKFTVFEDTNGALKIAMSPEMTPCTEWIAIKHHFFADHIGEEKGTVLEKIETDRQTADVFTEGFVGRNSLPSYPAAQQLFSSTKCQMRTWEQPSAGMCLCMGAAHN